MVVSGAEIRSCTLRRENRSDARGRDASAVYPVEPVRPLGTTGNLGTAEIFC